MTFKQWAEPLCEKHGVNINGITHLMGTRLGEKLKSSYSMMLSDKIIADCIEQYLFTNANGKSGHCPSCKSLAFGNDLIFSVGDIPYFWGAFVCSGECGDVDIGRAINPPN